MPLEQFRNVIIGTGEAGKFLAWHQAGLGEPTAVIERNLLGGACPNVACLPSKNVIHSAKVKSLLDAAADFGISTGPATLDMRGVYERKRRMVQDLAEIHQRRFAASGAELIFGEANFRDPRTVEVLAHDGSVRTLRGDRIFIATGSRATVPAIPGLADACPMTHVEALDLTRLPEHLVVIGGGYVGLELAQALRRFGSRITILEHSSRLTPRDDEDVAAELLRLMNDEGIDVRMETAVMNVTGRSGEAVQVEFQQAGEPQTLAATDLLIATGRTPNTDRLHVELAGVELDDHGHVRVNDRLETTAPGIWAMGDAAGSPHFTHVSFDDFRVVRDNLAGGNRSTSGRIVPYVLFTDPQLSRVGLNEHEAQQQGLPYRVATIPMAAVLRTRTLSETRGFAKVLVGDDDRILGLTAFGSETAEMLAAIQTAMVAGLPYQALRDVIFPHPTIAEGLGTLLSGIEPRQLLSVTA